MILLMKSDNDALFGAFLDEIIQCNDIDHFYGGNESFIFTIAPKLV